MQFTSYSVGLVLSRAGLNHAQMEDVKARLRFILKTMTPGGDGLTLTVPEIPPDKRNKDATVLPLVAPFQKMDGLKIVVVANVRVAADCASLFRDCDEVWCCPGERPNAALPRAHFVYDLRVRDIRPTKYKLIPPWIELVVPEAKTPRKERS